MSTSRSFFRRRTHPTLLDPSLQFCEGLTEREVQRATQLFSFVDVGSGRSLGRRGEVGREFTVILAGRVAVSVEAEAVAVLEAGHHFGAIPLLRPLEIMRRPASFDTLTPTSLAVANRAEFNTLLREIPSLRERIVPLAAMRQDYFAGLRPADAVPARAEASTFPVDLPAEPIADAQRLGEPAVGSVTRGFGATP